jgi:hypothetical protein
MVKGQDGLVSASLVGIFVAVLVGFGSGDASVENVLAGLTTPELNNYILNMEDYSQPEYGMGMQAPEYDNDYGTDHNLADDDYFVDAPLPPQPQPIETLKQVQQRSDVTRADVPKTGQHKPASHPSSSEAVSAVLPAYCDPPNPCPLGYRAEDGCIEGFENTSEFSRRYQSTQNCICDTEHMFNCPSQTSGDAAEAPSSHMPEHDDAFLADMENPYLTGEKLHVAAKKGGPNY